MQLLLILALTLLLPDASQEHNACTSNSTDEVLSVVMKLRDTQLKMETKLAVVFRKQNQLMNVALNNSKQLKSLQTYSVQSHSLFVPLSFPAGTRPITAPADCSQLYTTGYRHSGIYAVRPAGRASFDVWCSAGYTTLHRRSRGNVSFDRPWLDYMLGFGSLTGDHWLGLEYMHWLTKDSPQLLIINLTLDAKHHDPGQKYVIVSRFAVGAGTGYILTARGISTNLKDTRGAYRLEASQNGMRFSTKERDQDGFSGNCAQICKSGFWYNGCNWHTSLTTHVGSCTSGNRVCGDVYPYDTATEEILIRK